MAMKTIKSTTFGNTAYPDCPDAGEIAPNKDCLCNALFGVEHCSPNGEYWCGVATSRKLLNTELTPLDMVYADAALLSLIGVFGLLGTALVGYVVPWVFNMWSVLTCLVMYFMGLGIVGVALLCRKIAQNKEKGG